MTTVETTRNGSGTSRLHLPPDRELWHDSAPASLARHGDSLGDGEAWQAWVRHLTRRRRPADTAKLFRAKKSPLLWGRPEDLAGSDAFDLVTRLHRARQRKSRPGAALVAELETWLHDVAAAEPQAEYGYACLAWCHALPWLSQSTPAAQWWEALFHLVGTANEAKAGGRSGDLLGQQLLATELPLTLAYLFPEIQSCRALEAPAREALSDSLHGSLDSEAMLPSRHWHQLRAILACWLRSRVLDERLAGAAWDTSLRERFDTFACNLLRLTRRDGSQMLTAAGSGSWSNSFAALLVEKIAEPRCRRAARLALGFLSSKAAPTAKLPEPSLHAEDSTSVVLRSSWPGNSEALAVTFSGTTVETELIRGRELFWSGEWTLEVAFNDEPKAADDEWQSVCWQTDEDVVYLELQMHLEDELQVQRQMLLAREDRVLLLADAIVSPRPGRLSYRSTLPLAEGVSFVAEEKTREGVLTGRKRQPLVMPLALPEWKSDRRIGRLMQDAAGLTLTQDSQWLGLYAPLLIDLDPGRRAKDRTWRQLTVAEHRNPLPPDEAVGFRAQIGKRQWLLYRSLAPVACRTVLGQNLVTEFLMGRIKKDGTIDGLLEIE